MERDGGAKLLKQHATLERVSPSVEPAIGETEELVGYKYSTTSASCTLSSTTAARNRLGPGSLWRVQCADSQFTYPRHRCRWPQGTVLGWRSLGGQPGRESSQAIRQC